MKKIYIPIFFILLILFTYQLIHVEKKISVSLEDKNYFLQQARTNERRLKGLSEIKNLKSDQGMIFYFDERKKLSFWMKNTHIPLQIIFVDGCKVIDIQNMEIEKDPSNPQKKYISAVPADKAIEINFNSLKNNFVGKIIPELCQK